MLLPWTAHFYTALGAVAALFAALAVVAGDFRSAFLWLAVQVFIDATDGVLARAVRVKERIPWFDGAGLDNVIDYATYVFIPAMMLAPAGLVPTAWAPWIASAIVLSGAFAFGRTDSKLELHGQHFFVGFPSYWNIVVLYLYIGRLSPMINTWVLLVFVALVFIPLRYVYPSRTTTMQWPTVILGVLWAAIVCWMIWRLPQTDGPWLMLSLVFPIYYAVLSLWVDFRSR